MLSSLYPLFYLRSHLLCTSHVGSIGEDSELTCLSSYSWSVVWTESGAGSFYAKARAQNDGDAI